MLIKDYQIASIILFMFFLSGLEKIKSYNKTAESLIKMVLKQLGIKLNLLPSQIVILCVIILEILCPIIIVYYLYSKNKTLKTPANISTLLLIIFTILATLLYHFPPSDGQWHSFKSNITTIGGLLLLRHVIIK